jgi:hypothetical protein
MEVKTPKWYIRNAISSIQKILSSHTYIIYMKLIDSVINSVMTPDSMIRRLPPMFWRTGAEVTKVRKGKTIHTGRNRARKKRQP